MVLGLVKIRFSGCCYISFLTLKKSFKTLLCIIFHISIFMTRIVSKERNDKNDVSTCRREEGG